MPTKVRNRLIEFADNLKRIAAVNSGTVDEYLAAALASGFRLPAALRRDTRVPSPPIIRTDESVSARC